MTAHLFCSAESKCLFSIYLEILLNWFAASQLLTVFHLRLLGIALAKVTLMSASEVNRLVFYRIKSGCPGNSEFHLQLAVFCFLLLLSTFALWFSCYQQSLRFQFPPLQCCNQPLRSSLLRNRLLMMIPVRVGFERDQDDSWHNQASNKMAPD